MADSSATSISNSARPAQVSEGDLCTRKVEEIPDGRPYRSGEVRGKKLPAQLVRSTGLLSHMGTPREEWAILAIAARLSEVTEGSEADAVRYRNVHTRTEHQVEREEDTIHKSRLSFVEDLRRRIWKKAKSPDKRELREDWPEDLRRDYDRIRHSIERLEEQEYLQNEGPAVEADNELVQSLNGLRWAVQEEFRDLPDAKPQRRFVRCTGPEPEIDRSALHFDVLDSLERIVAYRESLHEQFTAGWKAEQPEGDWTPHTAKADARRSHQWTARNGTSHPQYISVGRWRTEEIEEDATERAVTMPWVVFDIDAESRERCGELGSELIDRLAEHLSEDQLEDVVCSYSGGTSVHVRVPAGLLGNPVFKSADAAARALSEFADELCGPDSELRAAIDDRLFHPRQLVRMIGSTYAADTDAPDCSSWRPWLIRRLLTRPQVQDRAHAAELADQVLDFLHRRHLHIDDVTLRFSGTRPVTIEDAPDQTPNANRVVACTGTEYLRHGAEPLWARSECGAHQPFELPDPSEAEYSPQLANLLNDGRGAGSTPHPCTRKKSDASSVAKQPVTGEYARALKVTREGEKWGRDVNKPSLVGRNRAALTVSLYKLTHSTTPWQDVQAWNRGMAEPLPEPELKKTFRSAERYLN